MAAKLSTHALDTYHGKPAAGLLIQLFRIDASSRLSLIKSCCTNADGRTDVPLLDTTEIQVGRYELVFDVGGYFAALGIVPVQPAFLGEVPVRFAIANSLSPYHVPLAFSPWAYSTYRGS